MKIFKLNTGWYAVIKKPECGGAKGAVARGVLDALGLDLNKITPLTLVLDYRGREFPHRDLEIACHELLGWMDAGVRPFQDALLVADHDYVFCVDIDRRMYGGGIQRPGILDNMTELEMTA